jgi:hypothetical protein
MDSSSEWWRDMERKDFLAGVPLLTILGLRMEKESFGGVEVTKSVLKTDHGDMAGLCTTQDAEGAAGLDFDTWQKYRGDRDTIYRFKCNGQPTPGCFLTLDSNGWARPAADNDPIIGQCIAVYDDKTVAMFMRAQPPLGRAPEVYDRTDPEAYRRAQGRLRMSNMCSTAVPRRDRTS